MGQQASQQNQPLNPDDPNAHATWWCKLLARTAGIIGAGIALILGFWSCISLSAICIGAGIVQILLSLIVLIMEAPCCFTYVEVAKPIAAFAENRPFLQKAIFYCVLAIFPIAMCFGLSTLFGAGLIFACGVIYGLMALGKKADRETMMQRASGGEAGFQSPQEAAPPAAHHDKVNLVDNESNPNYPSSYPTNYPH